MISNAIFVHSWGRRSPIIFSKSYLINQWLTNHDQLDPLWKLLRSSLKDTELKKIFAVIKLISRKIKADIFQDLSWGQTYYEIPEKVIYFQQGCPIYFPKYHQVVSSTQISQFYLSMRWILPDPSLLCTWVQHSREDIYGNHKEIGR